MRPFRFVSIASVVVLVVAMFAAGANASGHTPGQQLWVARHDGPAHGDDRAAAIARSADGTVIYVGGSVAAGPGRGDDLAVLAYGASGGLRWVRTYDGSVHGSDAATAIASGPARVYVTGTSNAGRAVTDTDYVTMGYTSGGTRLWARRYDTGPNGADAASAIALSPDGSTVFVAGTTATVAYRSDGTKLWSAPTTPGRYLAVSPDGPMVFVTRLDGVVFVTQAFNTATGKGPWTARFSPGDGQYFSVAGVAVSSDGTRVYVGGYMWREMDQGYAYLIAYDVHGSQLWVAEYADYRDDATALAVSPDGSRIYLGGDTPFIAAYTPSGRKVWSTSLYAVTGSHLAAVAVSPDGERLYGAGTTDRVFHPGDYFTSAVSSAGSSLWHRTYGAVHGPDEAVGVVVSPDGSSVYVTGTSGGRGTRSDIVTVAYRTS